MMLHPADGTEAARRSPRRHSARPSLLLLGVGARLIAVTLILGTLWLAVAWSLSK